MIARRSRPVCAVTLAAVVAAGLGSRVYGAATSRPAASALAWSVAVEISQLYRAPWLDAIRRTLPGALVLGHGFLWSDLACYVAGVALGAAIDVWVLRHCGVEP